MLSSGSGETCTKQWGSSEGENEAYMRCDCLNCENTWSSDGGGTTWLSIKILLRSGETSWEAVRDGQLSSGTRWRSERDINASAPNVFIWKFLMKMQKSIMVRLTWTESRFILNRVRGIRIRGQKRSISTILRRNGRGDQFLKLTEYKGRTWWIQAIEYHCLQGKWEFERVKINGVIGIHLGSRIEIGSYLIHLQKKIFLIILGVGTHSRRAPLVTRLLHLITSFTYSFRRSSDAYLIVDLALSYSISDFPSILITVPSPLLKINSVLRICL